MSVKDIASCTGISEGSVQTILKKHLDLRKVCARWVPHLLTDPWVLNFPPCRGPGGSIPTGNVASVVSSNCPLWEERRENTTRLPWVAARKPEEGILEVESYWEFGLS